ncbi:MAG: hypothetical protein WBA89_24660 [Microcoleus sp.]|uniref:hypothetical protein n=1 Tax=Microcoleus sp. TaxID=44472 RepID=UPI003C77A953
MSTNYFLPTADACLCFFCTPSHQVYQRRGSLRAQAVALFVLTFASFCLGGSEGVRGAGCGGDVMFPQPTVFLLYFYIRSADKSARPYLKLLILIMGFPQAKPLARSGFVCLGPRFRSPAAAPLPQYCCDTKL